MYMVQGSYRPALKLAMNWCVDAASDAKLRLPRLRQDEKADGGRNGMDRPEGTLPPRHRNLVKRRTADKTHQERTAMRRFMLCAVY